MEHLEKRVETLVKEKGLLEEKVKQHARQLVVEESMRQSRRQIVKGDVVWLLWEGIVWVVDRVIESIKFSIRVRDMKAVCVAAGLEGGRQAMKEQVASRKLIRMSHELWWN